MLLIGCDLENMPALHSSTNPKVILTPAISFIIETSSYLGKIYHKYLVLEVLLDAPCDNEKKLVEMTP